MHVPKSGAARRTSENFLIRSGGGAGQTTQASGLSPGIGSSGSQGAQHSIPEAVDTSKGAGIGGGKLVRVGKEQKVKQTEVAVDRLWALLRSSDDTTTNTSMRIPRTLRDAAQLAVREFGVADSTTALTADALRTMLEAVAMRASLEAHYEEYPQTRPTLAQVAVAAARLDRHPLADRPDVLTAAARQVVLRRPDADADDVLLWAEAQQEIRI